MLGDALIDALVAAADEQQPVERGVLARHRLVKPAALRRKQRHPLPGVSSRPDRFHRFKDRLRFQQHPLSAAERPVVDRAMTVMSPVSQIVDTNFDQPRLPGALHHAVLEWPAEKFRKDRQDVKLHLQAKAGVWRLPAASFPTNPASPPADRCGSSSPPHRFRGRSRARRESKFRARRRFLRAAAERRPNPPLRSPSPLRIRPQSGSRSDQRGKIRLPAAGRAPAPGPEDRRRSRVRRRRSNRSRRISAPAGPGDTKPAPGGRATGALRAVAPPAPDGPPGPDGSYKFPPETR